MNLPERIVPRRRGPDAGTPPAKLAGTLLSVAAAGLVEPTRFRRGREYVGTGAVTELLVGPRRLGASVQGSRSEAYRVEIAVDAAARPAGMGDVPEREHLVHLSPASDELVCSCTCPDGYQPCKHVAAALLCFADEISWRPELLVRWRCGDTDTAGTTRARAGSRADRLRLPRPVAPTSPFATPEWQAFLGAPAPLPTVTQPVELLPLGAARLGPFDVAAWVRTAQRSVQSTP
jgi:hypothetical protein